MKLSCGIFFNETLLPIFFLKIPEAFEIRLINSLEVPTDEFNEEQ